MGYIIITIYQVSEVSQVKKVSKVLGSIIMGYIIITIYEVTTRSLMTLGTRLVTAWLIMVEVVRNNFEDLFLEIKEAIEQSAFVGE